MEEITKMEKWIQNMEEYQDDVEYLSSQCPTCLRQFESDDELLAHICLEKSYE